MPKATTKQIRKLTLEEVLNEMCIPEQERKSIAITIRKEIDKLEDFKKSSRFQTMRTILEVQEQLLRNQKEILRKLEGNQYE